MKDVQFLNTNELEQMQIEQLQQLLHYLRKNSPFYKNLFLNNVINIDEINSLIDLQKLPFTTKADLQKHNNDFICVSTSEIIDYVTTSGTLGKPVTIALTDKDLDRLALNECNSFKITGGTKNDIYQLMTTIDRRFMAGMAYFLGARKLNAGIVRVGNGIPELQWDTIKRIKPTVIIAVPSFILKLIEYAEHHQINYKESSIKKAICIGEPLRNEDFSLNTLGKKIKEKWNIELYSTYASSEMAAAFTECEYGEGGHLQPDLLIAEIIDENDKTLKPGETGELVITTLGLEAMPLLRFKTGDICRMYIEKCKCGRTTPRISPVLGRKQQMIKYKGTTFYPNALYDILDIIDDVKAYQIELFTNEIGTDELLVKIACSNASEKLEKDIKDHFRARLRVAPAIQFENFEKLNSVIFPATTRKPIKFIDRRTSIKTD